MKTLVDDIGSLPLTVSLEKNIRQSNTTLHVIN